jgi:hypothetical protein
MEEAPQAVLSVRAGPRPDPIRVPRAPFLRAHAPGLGLLALGALASALLPEGALGLLACAVAAATAATAVTRGRLALAAASMHAAAGTVALAIVHGFPAAGAFVPVALVLVAAGFLANAAARALRPSVAPLAGVAPWSFVAAYRLHSLLFGVAGLFSGLALALFGPSPELRILGPALLPLALRCYAAQFAEPRALGGARAAAFVLEAGLLAFFVPGYGARAAAWSLVAAESALFVVHALAVARRTGALPFSFPAAAAATGSFLLLASVALPSDRMLPSILAAAFLVGVSAGSALADRRKTCRARNDRVGRGPRA